MGGVSATSCGRASGLIFYPSAHPALIFIKDGESRQRTIKISPGFTWGGRSVAFPHPH